MQTKYDTILVLDFGGQYCHLIGRRIREHGVYSEIVPHDITSTEIEALNEKFNIKGLILSGGPSSVYEPNAPRIDPNVLKLDLPVLGLCYGHQLIAQLVKVKFQEQPVREYGIAEVNIDKAVGVLDGLSAKETVWMSHGDTVSAVPIDYEVLAHTEAAPSPPTDSKQKPIYGLQWHPEVVHTKKGAHMLRNYHLRSLQV